MTGPEESRYSGSNVPGLEEVEERDSRVWRRLDQVLRGPVTVLERKFIMCGQCKL